MITLTIRRKVLNMSLEMWGKLDKKFGKDCIEFDTNPKEFLESIGLPGVLTAFCNPIEKAFFDELYRVADEEI